MASDSNDESFGSIGPPPQEPGGLDQEEKLVGGVQSEVEGEVGVGGLGGSLLWSLKGGQRGDFGRVFVPRRLGKDST